MTTIKNKSTKYPKPGQPNIGVRVWYGREYVEGPDCRLTGWFFAVYDEEREAAGECGEGDCTGPFNGRNGRAECTKLALEILETL